MWFASVRHHLAICARAHPEGPAPKRLRLSDPGEGCANLGSEPMEEEPGADINDDVVNFGGEAPATSDGSGDSGNAPSASRTAFSADALGVVDGTKADMYDRLINGGPGGREGEEPDGEDDAAAGATASQLAALLERVKLTEQEKTALLLAKRLPLDELTKLLVSYRVLGREVCRWKTAAEFNAWLTSVPILGHAMEEVLLLKITPKDREFPVTCRYVKDIKEVLQYHAHQGGVVHAREVRTPAGERLYGRVELSKRVEENEVRLEPPKQC